MEREFIPYTEALELKKLGFNEPCFAFYDDIDDDHPVSFIRIESLCDKLKSSITLAPLYQQAFRWFREKYNLISCVKSLHYGCELKINRFCYDIVDKTGIGSYDIYNNYEKAELECLKELIEIVKEKQL